LPYVSCRSPQRLTLRFNGTRREDEHYEGSGGTITLINVVSPPIHRARQRPLSGDELRSSRPTPEPIGCACSQSILGIPLGTMPRARLMVSRAPLAAAFVLPRTVVANVWAISEFLGVVERAREDGDWVLIHLPGVG
jgi:hypothetical protein